MPTLLQAQTNFSGGNGLSYLQSAWTLDPGSLTVSVNTRGFGSVADFTGSDAYTVWTVSGRFSFNYGVSRHFEVLATPIIYQDTNFGSKAVNAPDDIFLSMKAGSFSSPGSSLAYGVLLSTRIPAGKIHNMPFEPYSANSVGFGLTTLLSYSRDPLYPEEAANVHVNVGYWNHNDVGTTLVEDGGTATEPRSISQEIVYGLGVRFPRGKFDKSMAMCLYTLRRPRIAEKTTCSLPRWFIINQCAG